MEYVETKEEVGKPKEETRKEKKKKRKRKVAVPLNSRGLYSRTLHIVATIREQMQMQEQVQVA